MKIIVGLGNPGREYAATRHNLGFMVVDRLFARLGGTAARPRFRSELADVSIGGEKVILVKPQTYMNLSGTAVREVASWYRVAPAGLLVILDDLDLPFGNLRVRGDGTAGGHNGLRSIIEQMGSTSVSRLRIGIGRAPGTARAQVLSRFSPDESQAVPGIVDRAADCCVMWVEEGLIPTMNVFNQNAPSAAGEPGTQSEQSR